MSEIESGIEKLELYCPSHFGNTYEVAMGYEIRDIMEDAAFWGFNAYADWFDTIDLYDLYRKKDGFYNLPEAMWACKFRNYELAAEAGLELGLCISPNHVFYDQVNPENAAIKGDHVFGQLVCPSKPGVTEMIIENYRLLFRDFARRGLRVSSLTAGAYDYGGCRCADCAPWIVTWGKLLREIKSVGQEIFGKLDLNILGWMWEDHDHSAFAEWVDQEGPKLVSQFFHHIPYGQNAWEKRPVPRNCGEGGFVHIGYGEKGGWDVYGHFGPVMAPDRIERTVAMAASRRVSHLVAYSEGVFDDINKALLGGLAFGRFSTADDVLKAYASRNLGGSPEGWAEWMRLMADSAKIDALSARRLFDRLKRESRQSLRLSALEGKLEMAEADFRVVTGGAEWDEKRIKAARSFWDAKERIWRGCWGMGMPRAIFRFDWATPSWNAEYMKAAGIIKHHSHPIALPPLEA